MSKDTTSACLSASLRHLCVFDPKNAKKQCFKFSLFKKTDLFNQKITVKLKYFLRVLKLHVTTQVQRK